MWHYCWAHMVFHLVRWFPRNNRVKIQILLMVFTFGLLIPQFFILFRPHSSRYCGQHLFQLLIISIIFSFCMAGFSFLFSLMEPVPKEVKIAFHVFGVLSFTLACLNATLTSLAGECRVFTNELYWLNVALSIFGMLAILWFTVVVPFWIVNKIWRDSVYDPRNREGVCYDPVTCCSCVWHI